MDSAVVNRAIRAEIRPLLRDLGFNQMTSRSAWRHHSDRVDVVNFQSFNSHLADGLGVTSFSFSVNLGCYLLYVPDHFPGRIQEKSGYRLPKEYECDLRGRLARAYEDSLCSRKDIWPIDKSGSNVTKALHDVRMALLRDGEPWFAQFNSPEAVHRILSHAEESEMLRGFGRRGSPIHCYLTGYAARAAGVCGDVKVNLLRAAESGSFSAVVDQLRRDAEGAC